MELEFGNRLANVTVDDDVSMMRSEPSSIRANSPSAKSHGDFLARRGPAPNSRFLLALTDDVFMLNQQPLAGKQRADEIQRNASLGAPRVPNAERAILALHRSKATCAKQMTHPIRTQTI